MSTQLHDAATWPRSVRQHIDAIAATLMLGLQVFRERVMNLGGYRRHRHQRCQG